MGLHHHFAGYLVAVLILTTTAQAQWREWTDYRVAVEDLTEAVRERCELTYSGTTTSDVRSCSLGVTVTNKQRSRSYSTRIGEYINGPIAWTTPQRANGSNLVISGYQTDTWTEVSFTNSAWITNTLTQIYTNYITSDFAILTNWNCAVTTSDFVNVLFTNAPYPYLPKDFLRELDMTIAKLATDFSGQWALTDMSAFDPSQCTGTGWLWTVNNQWEEWGYSFAAPVAITHSQLCARAGIPVTNYITGINDRGTNWPKIITNAVYEGYKDGNYSVHYYDPPKVVGTTIEPRYVTNKATSGLWLYATTNELRQSLIDGKGHTQLVGRTLARLGTARGSFGWPTPQTLQARGLGAADGYYTSTNGYFKHTSASLWVLPAEYYFGHRSYILNRAPKHPDDYYYPESNALWSASETSGCYLPVVTNNPAGTTGDVVRVARLFYSEGESEWGSTALRFKPDSAPAYLWTTHNSTNDRWCARAEEPAGFPDPFVVQVVGSYLRGASNTQGPVVVTATQTVTVAAAGRLDLAFPFTAIASMTYSNTIGVSNSFYVRDGIEITACLGDYTEARELILDNALWWQSYWVSSHDYTASRAILEDRKRLLNAMAGLSLVRSPTITTNVSFQSSFKREYRYDSSSPIPPPSMTSGDNMPQCPDWYDWWLDCYCNPLMWMNPGANGWQFKSDSGTTFQEDHRKEENTYPNGETAVIEDSGTTNRYSSIAHGEAESVSQIGGILTERVPCQLAMLTVANPSAGVPYEFNPICNGGESSAGGVNAVVVKESGYQLDVFVSGDSCETYSIGVTASRTYTTNRFVIPPTAGVLNFMKYAVNAAPTRSGETWSVIPTHPGWPKNRFKYASQDINVSGSDSAAYAPCTWVEDFGDGWPVDRERDGQSVYESHTYNVNATHQWDGYGMDAVILVTPTFRYR